MNLPLRKKLEEVSQSCGVPREMILYYIESEWIEPIDREHSILDLEDESRVRLIWELKEDFGVNDEAMPIILHLIDQLNFFQIKAKSFQSNIDP